MNRKMRFKYIDFHLAKVDGRVFGAKIMLALGFVTLGIWLGSHASWIEKAASWGILGCMFAHMVELQHQALHNTGFRSKRLNRIVGILLGIPMMVSFSEYQASHLRHHRLIGTPEDQESFDYDYESLKGLLAWIGHLLMARHYGKKLRALLRALRSGTMTELARRIRAEHRLILTALLAATGASVLVGIPLVLNYWLIPLFLVAAPLHVLIELPEHVGCDPSSTDVLRNTRTIRTGWFGRWFTNGNNFHVEHHWHPGVQVEAWDQLHGALGDQIEFLEPSYWAFYRRFLRALHAGRVNDPTYWAQRNRAQATEQPEAVHHF